MGRVVAVVGLSKEPFVGEREFTDDLPPIGAEASVACEQRIDRRAPALAEMDEPPSAFSFACWRTSARRRCTSSSERDSS